MKRRCIIHHKLFFDFLWTECCRSAPEVSCPRVKCGTWSALKTEPHLRIHLRNLSMNQDVQTLSIITGARRRALRWV